jgi:predicted dehydrogenase
VATRIVQVGVGGFGGCWTDVLVKARSDAIAFVGMVDTNRDVLAERAAAAGIDEGARFTSLDEALDELKPDVVVCVVPPAAHAEVATVALQAGAHVISEKPLADTMEGARQIVEAADTAGRKLAVSQNYRYSRQAIAVREIMKQGRIGEPASVSLEFFRGPLFEGSFRRHMAFPLVTDMSIHHYDLMRAILSRDPQWTVARSVNPPWSWYEGAASIQQTFGFEGDVTGSYSASWCSLGYETPWSGNWRIEGSEGCVIWRDDKVFIGRRPDTLEVVALPEDRKFGQEAVLDEFLSALGEGRDPETSGHDNLKSLGMVFATVEASETGAVVQL